MRYVLDTSTYSQFKRGDDEAVQVLSHATWVGVPVTVLGELHAGFLAGRRATINEKELRAFLREPVVEIVDLSHETARVWAEIISALRGAGTPLPTNDIWIAAAAACAGAPVLTYDAHFERIARIGVVRLGRATAPHSRR
jgi:tRNA(fMet)-specific endonuclease VapC